MYCHTETVHNLAGYTSDLKHLLCENKHADLSFYVFDQFVQKVV
jgi:hypothetical protein